MQEIFPRSEGLRDRERELCVYVASYYNDDNVTNVIYFGNNNHVTRSTDRNYDLLCASP
jgi:hypothetical protein